MSAVPQEDYGVVQRNLVERRPDGERSVENGAGDFDRQ